MKRHIPLILSILLLASCTPTPQESAYWQMRGLVLSTKELAEVD